MSAPVPTPLPAAHWEDVLLTTRIAPAVCYLVTGVSRNGRILFVEERSSDSGEATGRVAEVPVDMVHPERFVIDAGYRLRPWAVAQAQTEGGEAY